MSDEHGSKSNSEPTSDPAETSFTCDWGDCEYESKFWRWSSNLSMWLPVCWPHSENGEQFYAGLNADYRNTRGASS